VQIDLNRIINFNIHFLLNSLCLVVIENYQIFALEILSK